MGQLPSPSFFRLRFEIWKEAWASPTPGPPTSLALLVPALRRCRGENISQQNLLMKWMRLLATVQESATALERRLEGRHRVGELRSWKEASGVLLGEAEISLLEAWRPPWCTRGV